MRIFMVSDIEGLTGVYHWAQTKPGNPAYDEARELLMGDLLAAVEGAHDGGADEIVVYDMHESGRNISISYTHLDVYKRQGIGNPSVAIRDQITDRQCYGLRIIIAHII